MICLSCTITCTNATKWVSLINYNQLFCTIFALLRFPVILDSDWLTVAFSGQIFPKILKLESNPLEVKYLQPPEIKIVHGSLM